MGGLRKILPIRGISYIFFTSSANLEPGLQWRLPSQLVVTSDPLVREVVPGSLLRQCLNLDYLHAEVAAMVNSQMKCCLGVQTLNTQHLLEVGKAVVVRLSDSQDDSGIFTSGIIVIIFSE